MSNNPDLHIKQEDVVVDHWLMEKSDKALESLSEMVDLVKNDDNVSSLSQDEILGRIRHVSSYVSKIMAMAHASLNNWSIDDPELIVKHGYRGYRALSAKYRGTNIELFLTWDQLWENLKVFLEGDRSNRRDIYDLLSYAAMNDKRLDQMHSLLDSLMMGESNWSNFVESARKIGGD